MEAHERTVLPHLNLSSWLLTWVTESRSTVTYTGPSFHLSVAQVTSAVLVWPPLSSELAVECRLLRPLEEGHSSPAAQALPFSSDSHRRRALRGLRLAGGQAGQRQFPEGRDFSCPCFLGAGKGLEEMISKPTCSRTPWLRVPPWIPRKEVWKACFSRLAYFLCGCTHPQRSGSEMLTLQIGLLHLGVSGGGMVLLWKFLRQKPLCILLFEIPHQQGRASHLEDTVTQRP